MATEYSEDEYETELPPLPIKPQKTLFSYFNLNRSNKSTEGKIKNNESNIQKNNHDLYKPKKVSKDKERDKNRNSGSGISISLFGQNVAKKIGKKSPKVNGLDKFLTEIDSDENEGDGTEENIDDEGDDTTERGNNEHSDSTAEESINECDMDKVETDINVRDLPSEQLDNELEPCEQTREDIQENTEQTQPVCEKNDTTSHVTLNELSVKISDDKIDKKSITKEKNMEITLGPGNDNSLGLCDAKSEESMQVSSSDIVNSNDVESPAEELTPIKDKRKKKKNTVENVQMVDNIQSNESNNKKTNSSPSTKKKVLKSKSRKSRVQFDSSIEESPTCVMQRQDEQKLELLTNESPNKVQRKHQKMKQQFESSDEEEVDVVATNNVNSEGKEEEAKTSLISCEEKMSAYSESLREDDLIEGITPLDNEMLASVKTHSKGVHMEFVDSPVDIVKKKPEMIGTVYPTSSTSGYKCLIRLTKESKIETFGVENSVQKPVEVYLRILQKEYPDIAVKKIFLQLLECQKMVITKNLTKVESSKKVLETLWERDSQLKSEEIALAEEMRRKNEELALAELKKKQRNDIRMSFMRTKKRKKKVVETLNSEEINVDSSVGNDSDSLKKGKKEPKDKKIHVDEKRIDIDASDKVDSNAESAKKGQKKQKKKKSSSCEEISVEEDSKGTCKDIRQSFQCTKVQKKKDANNSEVLDVAEKEPKKGRKRGKSKEIMDLIVANTLEDEDEVNDPSTSEKKCHKRRNSKKITNDVEDNTIYVEDSAQSSKKDKKRGKNKSIKDMMVPDKIESANDNEDDNAVTEKVSTKDSQKQDKRKSIIDTLTPGSTGNDDSSNDSDSKKVPKKCKRMSIIDMMCPEDEDDDINKTESKKKSKNRSKSMINEESELKLPVRRRSNANTEDDEDSPDSGNKEIESTMKCRRGRKSRSNAGNAAKDCVEDDSKKIIVDMKTSTMKCQDNNFVTVKLGFNPNPLEEVTILDNSQNISDGKKAIKIEKRSRQKLKSCKGIKGYMQNDLFTDSKDEVKVEMSETIAADVIDGGTIAEDDNDNESCNVKTETVTPNSSLLGSEDENNEACLGETDRSTSRKRKLTRASSGSKKKRKLLSEKPVTRRRSSRNHSIDLNSNDSGTVETSDSDKVGLPNDVKKYPYVATGTVHDNDLMSEKENIENLNDDKPNLRRSTRVRKQVVAFVPNDIEMYEEEYDCKSVDENINDCDIKNESDDSIIVTSSSQENSDNIEVLKTTLSRAIETLDLLEQSPCKSPKKVVLDIKFDEQYINSCLSWTEKYQPNKARYVIGEKSSTRQIFDWLLLWKERHESALKKIARSAEKTSKRRSDYSDSESEESEFEDYLSNTIMLSGPSGCGTTAAVHACASQLDFKVLELNPSTYRTGKQIFDQVSEAVVSHQVNKLADVSDCDKQSGDSAKKDNFFMPKREKPTTKKDVNTTVKPAGESSLTSTSVDAMSLVLFEQVDIVYEEIDRGFYQGITDLRKLAKRPIILTANDPNVFENIFVDDDSWVEHISLDYPSVEKALPMLQLMCLVEYVFVPKPLLISIINSCESDIRKTILHLMFWCEQGKKPLFKIWNSKNKKDSESHLENVSEMADTDSKETNEDIVIDSIALATEVSPNILPVYEDESILNLRQISNDGICSCKSIHGNYSFTKHSNKDLYSSIDHIADTADSISEINSFLNIDRNDNDRDCFNWTSSLTDSLCDTFTKEKENVLSYPIASVCKNVKKICKQNYDELFLEKQDDLNNVNISYSDTYRSVLNSHSAKYHINRKPFLEDVIPYMNRICQLEDIKLSSIHHRKRGNRRYMHYLQSVGIHLDEKTIIELSKPLV